MYRPPFDFPHRATRLAHAIGYSKPVRVEYRVRSGRLADLRVTAGSPPPALARELLAWTARHGPPPDGQRATVFHFEEPVAVPLHDGRFFFRCGCCPGRARLIDPPASACRLIPVDDFEPGDGDAGGSGAGRTL